MKDIADLLARICIASIFLFEAYDSTTSFQRTKVTLAEFGLTWQPSLLIGGAICLLIIGGILILIGYRTAFGAVLLLAYWIPATFILYSFWNDPVDLRREQSIDFMKNMAIIGALLLMYANGSGKYSIKRLFATTKVKSRSWLHR